MNYEEAVNYIESQAIYGLKPGMERIDGLLDRLGHPEKGMQYIHVAGTNGKGSVCTETANILHAAGYHVGLFTSPYIVDFRERIRVDGHYIDKDVMGELTQKVKNAVDDLATLGIQPTEFEIITALGFLYFQYEKCEVVVLEVGLGGLLDSTNVIENPLVCGIVSLSLDHTAILGDTIEEIAFQKAGIMKPGRPVVTCEGQPEAALKVLKDIAAEKGCTLTIGSTEGIAITGASIYGMHMQADGMEFILPLVGDHQVQNLGVTLGLIRELQNQGFHISPEHVKAGLEETRIPARLEVLRKEPLVLLDGGHNAGGVAALTNALAKHTEDGSRVFMMGVMADKEVNTMVASLTPLADTIVTCTPSNSRAMKAEDLKDAILATGFPADKVFAVSSPVDAADKTLALADGRPTIVCGSLYLAGDVREHLEAVLAH